MNYVKRVGKLWEHIRFRFFLLFFVLMIFFLGVLIVPIESISSDRNINTISDGIWWSVTTVTSVGYGDTYPVTPLGRTIGMILMISGTFLTGLILGFVTVTLFHSRDEYYWRRISSRLDRMEDKLDVIQKKQSYMVKSFNHDSEEEL